jgi:hypothetical protein
MEPVGPLPLSQVPVLSKNSDTYSPNIAAGYRNFPKGTVKCTIKYIQYTCKVSVENTSLCDKKSSENNLQLKVCEYYLILFSYYNSTCEC